MFRLSLNNDAQNLGASLPAVRYNQKMDGKGEPRRSFWGNA